MPSVLIASPPPEYLEADLKVGFGLDDANKRYIIARLYCYGDLRAIKWIKETYSKEDIKEVAIKSRDLKPLAANYLRQQFDLKKEEMAYYKTVQGMNYEFWRVNN